MAKKRIICFGDSNTWGCNPLTQARFGEHERWTGVLQRKLGDGYCVIEEGLNGRTTVWDDPIELHKNGYKYLFPMMESHKPFDLIVIMLGTNDLKRRFSVNTRDIAQSVALLAKEAMRSECGPEDASPKALLVAPIHIDPNIMNSRFAEMFEQDCIIRSRHFNHWFSEFAHEIGSPYMNAADFAEPDPADCLHISQNGHKALGEAIAKKVRGIIG